MEYEEALESIKYELYEEGHCTYIEQELETAIKALERQIPKKPKRYITDFPSCCKVSKCPSCGQEFGFNDGFNFCENCGQAIDWSDT